MAFDTIARRIDDLTDECVDFLARICAIPALGPENGGTGETAKYQLITQELRALNPDEQIEIHAPDVRVPDGVRPNLAVTFRGANAAKKLWIMTHIDVVPPGELDAWDHDPFDPVVKDGFLYGRGVEDNGLPLAAALCALKAVKENGGPGLDVGLVLVSDEETGSLLGLDYVLEQRRDLFKADDLIIVPDAGNKDGDQIEVAEKHLVQVKFRVKGKQGHASRPDHCRNTLRASAHLIVELDEGLKRRFGDRNEFYGPPHSTFEPTKKEANVPNINTIPGEDVVYFDCRILPELDPDEALAEMDSIAEDIRKRFEVEIEIGAVMKFVAPQPTAMDAPVVIALAQAVHEVLGVQARPVGIGGQTVAAFVRKRGLPAAVWSRILETAHAPNERIAVDHLMQTAKVFARMMV